MRIVISAVGTLGGVQPFVALGLGLAAAGHSVRMLTSSNLENFVRSCGLNDCVSVVDDTRRWTAWLARDQSRSKLTGLLPSLYGRQEGLRGMLETFMAEGLEATKGADLVVSSETGYCVGQPIASKIGAPHCSAFVQPFHPTRAFPQLFWPQLPEGISAGRGLYNLATHRLTLWALERMFRQTLQQARERVLRMRSFRYYQDSLVLYGYSPSWIPRPRDWNKYIHVTGYWFLDRDTYWKPPDDLVRFLDSGPPPVYVGLGSLAGVKPEIMDIAVDALEQSGQRGVVATGWSTWTKERLPETVFAIDAAPHEWLFPRVAAVVHHAGAGTTGAGLRAGKATVTVPVMYDQFFFAHRVFKYGLGPRPLSLRNISTAQLREAIEQVTNDRCMQTRAEGLGNRIRAEPGVAQAVELINEEFCR